MSLQYVIYDYWDYGYTVGDAILEYGAGSITADAQLVANAAKVKTDTVSISAYSTLTADGHVLGSNWSDSTIGANSWTQINNLEYVLVDYWNEDYISEIYNYWDVATPSSNSWNLQG